METIENVLDRLEAEEERDAHSRTKAKLANACDDCSGLRAELDALRVECAGLRALLAAYTQIKKEERP